MRTTLLSDIPNPITTALRRYPDAIVFATPMRKVSYTELLLAAWHIDRYSPKASSLWIVRDDRDLILFLISNGVTQYERVTVV